MNEKIKEFSSFFSSLELNKNTDDVDLDLKQLQLGYKLKFYGFYLLVGAIAIYSYFYIEDSIKNDPFRKALMEQNGVAPLFTFLYSNYEDERIEISNEIEGKRAELRDLRSVTQKNFNSNSYKYKNYIEDIKSGRINYDVDKHILNSKAYKQYVDYYFISWCYKNLENTIVLNGKDYSIKSIMNKIYSDRLAKVQAVKKLEMPSKLILEKLNLDTSNEAYIKSLSTALYIIPYHNIRDKRLYSSMNIKLEDALKDLKEAIFNNGSRYFYKPSNKFVMIERILGYSDEKQKKSQELKRAYEEYKKNKAATDQKISDLGKEIALLSKQLRAIQTLQSDVANYKQNKEKLEKLLEGGSNE